MTAMPRGPVPSAVCVGWGSLPDGRAVDLVTLRAGALEVAVITYGGIIVSLHTPDRRGEIDDIVLGHDDVRAYHDRSPYFGAIIGRVANRIAGGRFTLDGVTHQLAQNDGRQHLHGGVRGFDKALWQLITHADAGGARALLTHTSPDGDEGYPGALEARVEYTLTPAAELIVDFAAATDRLTVVNLTQHSYFNLSGARAMGDVLAHRLTINAERYTPVDADLVPTGELADVAQTPFDFRSPADIGARIGNEHPQLQVAGGYDHNFALARPVGNDLAHAAR
ncbi:MAG: galactose mutarotase, partial [Gemmatimonadaceae bacterium]|nr:galactose mutarotase [Gemmatimonadaceae bacterium]